MSLRMGSEIRKQSAPELPKWLAKLVPFDRYLVEIDGRHMHVMEAGHGRPVLMLHGNPTWGFLYRKVASQLLASGFRVIMPDLMGLGFSDKPRDPSWHTIENHSDALGALIDGLDLRDAIFVGQDWGGPIGLHAWARRADRLGAMVILNTVVGPPRPGFHPTGFHRFAKMPLVSDLVFRGLSFPQRSLSLAQGDRRSIRGEVARAYRYPLRRFGDRHAPLALARMVPDGPSHFSIPALEAVALFAGQFDGPTRIVWGTKDPVLGRALKRTRKLLGEPAVVKTDAGHFLQEEVPDEIADAVRGVSAA